MMEWERVRNAKNETKKVNEIYRIFNEESRLNRSQAAKVEFITTVDYINRFLPKEGKLCDIGAGAGEYSFHFSRQGHEVTSVELSDANLEAFKKKMTDEDKINLMQGNALDLSLLPESYYDVVLLMGPLYHLEAKEDQVKVILEAKRICKPEGKIFVSFIANDMVMYTELFYNEHHFNEDSYNHDTFILNNFPFVFHTLDEMRHRLRQGDFVIEHAVAVDGLSELMEQYINKLDEYGFSQYMRFHLKNCEDNSALARSNHVTFIGR